MRRLFITGGHGFVGQWVRKLAASKGDPDLSIALPGTEFQLLDSAQVDRELSAARPDSVLHLAAQADVSRSFREPEATFVANFLGTLHLFQGLRRAGLSPRTLIVSSGDVYGLVPSDAVPIGETRPPRPVSPYAVSKLATEAMAYQWWITERLPAIVARPFNHIGAGQSDAFVLPAFARQIVEIKAGKREPVINVGDIDTTRDFTHVADIVDAYLLLLEKGEPGEIYNVCSGVDYRIRDLLERMLHFAGVKAGVRQDPSRLRPAEQRVVRGDNAKIRRLGWTPKRSIDDSLKEILADWERRISDG
jgi:GDP-4-dehydro-6-deoxy-D-mannose reductase